MCGIAGLCNWGDGWQRNIERMNEKMYHRGPDASGVWAAEDGRVVLGHRRLAIVDLTPSGIQPMESHCGRYVMAYNGEIYNYPVIRAKLLESHKVTAFHGTSDTEVLLEAIAAYGIKETLVMAKGMFAIAVYDKKERMLYLARDRVGEKPLYYGFVGENRFVFASDLHSIAALDGFQNPINTGILEQYFRYGYIPAPYSIYENIYKLKPGTILEVKYPFQQYVQKVYWSMTETAVRGQRCPFTGSSKEAAEELERLLKASVRGQMMADVPVGAFLSAGIDSSTIVALMQSQSEKKVKSFTIGMWDEKFNEADVAKEIARHLGTEHTELYITEEDARRVIPGLAEMFGEPFADSSQIPTYLVSKMTREHVTVSLSGDGGDELFCGYNTYASIDRIWRKTGRIPYGIRRPAAALLRLGNRGKGGAQATRARLLGARSMEDMYLRSEIGEGLNIVKRECRKPKQNGHLAEGSKGLLTVMDSYPAGLLAEPRHNLMLMDLLMYHPDDILNKVDRTAMAVSLETRVPMLDRDVVEFAWTLPLAYRVGDDGGRLGAQSGDAAQEKNGLAAQQASRGEIRKKILRDILYKYVPRELMERPKKGFSIPLEKWLKEPGLREWAESLIDRNTLERQGILDVDVVHRIWEDYIRRDVWRVQIWYILMFQEWMRYTGQQQ